MDILGLKKKNQYSKNTEKINPSSFPLQSTFNCESKAETFWSSRCGPGEMNWTSIHGDAGWISSLAQWVKYSALPWAVVYVGSCSSNLAWELPNAASATLKSKKNKNKNKKTPPDSLILCNLQKVNWCLENRTTPSFRMPALGTSLSSDPGQDLAKRNLSIQLSLKLPFLIH